MFVILRPLQLFTDFLMQVKDNYREQWDYGAQFESLRKHPAGNCIVLHHLFPHCSAPIQTSLWLSPTEENRLNWWVSLEANLDCEKFLPFHLFSPTSYQQTALYHLSSRVPRTGQDYPPEEIEHDIQYWIGI